MTTDTLAKRPAEERTEPLRLSGGFWLVVALAVVAVGAILWVVFSGGPPVLENGDFETGDLTGWSTETWGAGDWFVYEDGTTPPDPAITAEGSAEDPPFNVPDPPQGEFAAVADMYFMGAHFIYRDFEVTGPWVLHLTVFYEGHDRAIVESDSFGSFTGEFWTGPTIHLFRIDLIDPTASIHSLEADDVMATVFSTGFGDPTSMGPTPVEIDLAPWEGETVRLRAAVLHNTGPLRGGFDDVRLERAG